MTGGRYSEVVVSSGLTVFGYNDLGYNEHQVINQPGCNEHNRILLTNLAGPELFVIYKL